MNAYQPGRCNIGSRQRRRRLLVAGAGFGAAGLTTLAYVAGAVPAPALLAVFAFLTVGFEWGLQAYRAFCVRLAMLSRDDFRGDGGDAGTVAEPSARQDDRVRAVRFTVVGLVLAALVTGLLFALL
jgi:hypothetical protein